MLRSVQEFKPEDFQKKEKKNVRKNIQFLIQRRKKKLVKSQVTEWVDEMKKKNIKDFAAVRSFLNNKIQGLKDNTVGLYHMLVSAKIMNGTIGLTDTLANKKLKRYSYMLDLEGKIFSNDRLMIEDLFVRCSQLVDEKSKIEAKYQDASDVKSCRFCSPSFLYDGKCQKGYYQDFDEHFAAVGLEDLTVKEKEALLTFNKELWVRSWKYNNVQYHVYAYKDATVIASETIVYDGTGIELYNKMVTFQGGKKLALNWKQFELDKKIKYIDMKVFPDDFCPAFLILPRNVKINAMFVSEYNYNDLYQTIIDVLRENDGTLILPPNLFYWNQMDECMDFLAILALMPNNGLTDDQKKTLTDLYDRYKNLKPMLQAFGHIALRVVKYFKEFYYSFTTKINYDKLVSLQKKLAADLEEMRKLKNSDYYPEVIKWLQEMAEGIGVAQYCYKQATSAEFGGTIDKMILALNDLVDSKGNIIERLTNICKCIYFLTPCGEAGSQPCIPYLFAIGGHLGALSYTIIDKEILEKNIEDERKKKAELEKLVNDEKLRLERAMSNLKTNEERIIRNTIENYCKAKGKEVSNDVKNRWADILIAKISSDEGLKKKIHAEIAKIAMSRGEVTTEYMDDFDQLELLFEGYEAEKDLEKLKKKKRKLDSEIGKKRYELRDLEERKEDLDEPVEEIEKDLGELLADEDIMSVFDGEKSKNLELLSMDTTDSLGLLQDALNYITKKTPHFSIMRKNYDALTKKGGKLEKWVRAAIYGSNVYNWDNQNVDPGSNVIQLMKSYPISHNMIERMIKAGVIPPLKNYLLDKKVKLGTYVLSDDSKRMFAQNQKDISENDMYIPKYFYGLEPYKFD